MATVKNEGPNILEWVAHHRLRGFDRIQIYQNDSSDTTVQTLRILDRMGVVEFHENFHPKGAHQARAYRRAGRSETYASHDWCMVLDGDEFLSVKVGDGRVSDLVSAIPADADCILVNWKIFGSGGHEGLSDDLVTRRFTLSEPDAAVRGGRRLSPFKPLFRTTSYSRLGIHLPRRPTKTDPRVYNASGLRDGEFLRKNWRGHDPEGRAFAQVNHYMVRDKISFVLKHSRGSANNPERDVGLTYWQNFNLNNEKDLGLANCSETTWSEMKRLDELSGGMLLRLRNRALRQWRLAAETLLKDQKVKEFFDALN